MMDAIYAKTIETIVHDGIKEEVAKIVDEESEAASKRVVERVMALKTKAAENILSRFKIKQLEREGGFSVQIVFDV